MLSLRHSGEDHPIQNTEYYIRELSTGLDEIIFDISVWDPIYQIMAEEDEIVDRAGQRYLIKQIDGGAVTAKIVCQLDLDEWRATLAVGYDSGSLTVREQIEAVAPTGWTVQDRSGSSIQRTITGDLTPLQVAQNCCDTYTVYVRWDNKRKICTIYPKAMGEPVGAFATRELNLKEINYKGKSNNFATRLYAYGKDGLSFEDINDGKPYVDDNTYSSRVICAYWQDDRYTVEENLLADAREKLALLAVPERSYDCAIVDLQATNPELYNNLDFSLFTAATLIDDVKGTAVNYQVVERHVWPYHPDRNDVIFDNSPLKITTSVVQIQDAIENPNSPFQQIWNAKISAATDWLLSGDGYVVAVKGPDDEWKELLFMDTNDIATAQKVIRINENGIGFSTNGAQGPYTNAWTIDGQLNADFITTGTLNADSVEVIGQIKATSGFIGENASNGWNIGSKGIYNGCTGMNDTGNGLYIGSDGIRCNGNVGQAPGAWIKIAAGIIDAASLITAGGFAARSSGGFSSPSGGVTVGGDVYAGGSVNAGQYIARDSGGTGYAGTSGTIVWADENQRKTFGITVVNGIVTVLDENSY